MFFRKNVKNILIVIALLVIVFISYRGADGLIKGTILRISSPFIKPLRIFGGGVSGLFEFLGSIGNLKTENERLVLENRELVAKYNQLKDAEQENQVLRRELGFESRKDFDLAACFVIAQDPQGFGNYFVIDKGESSGIKTGMPAIVSGGILIGRVSESYPNTAKIVLITDPNSAINAEIQNSQAKGIVKGEYGLGLKMDMISQSEVLNDGDTVITSGLGGEVPRGLTIGKISRASQSQDKLFQEAAVIPAVDMSELRALFVIKK